MGADSEETIAAMSTEQGKCGLEQWKWKTVRKEEDLMEIRGQDGDRTYFRH